MQSLDEEEMALNVNQQSTALSQAPANHCHATAWSTELMTPDMYPDSGELLEDMLNRDRRMMAGADHACAI